LGRVLGNKKEKKGRFKQGVKKNIDWQRGIKGRKDLNEKQVESKYGTIKREMGGKIRSWIPLKMRF